MSSSAELVPLQRERYRELDERVSNDGIAVKLMWDSQRDILSVNVQDVRENEEFVVPATSENYLDVFNHPYAYRELGPLVVSAAYSEAQAA